mgnify:CR=1 FL=1
MRDIHEFEPLWGEWRTVKLLGQGSYGRVYLAEKIELGKRYYSAIKYIGIPNDDNQTKELYSEGLVTDDATLHHYYEQVLQSLMAEISINYELKGNANIVSYEEHKVLPRTHEAGYDIFIKMELLTSLTDHISCHALTVEDVVRIGCDICTALDVLQREKIIHRDVKPANIFIHSSGHFKLGDFGVARTMEKTVSSMSVKGTFAFMAPEVARGGDGDFRVDIYSLGLVLYRLLNGNRSPFLPPPPAPVSYNDNNLAQRRRMQGEALPPPAMADEALSAIVLKACAYLPQDRYQNAGEFYQALTQYKTGLTPQQAARVVLGKLEGKSRDPGSSQMDSAAQDGSSRQEVSEEDESTVFLPFEEPDFPAAEPEQKQEETSASLSTQDAEQPGMCQSSDAPAALAEDATVFLPVEDLVTPALQPEAAPTEATVYIPAQAAKKPDESPTLPEEPPAEELAHLTDRESGRTPKYESVSADQAAAGQPISTEPAQLPIQGDRQSSSGGLSKSKLPLLLGAGGGAVAAVILAVILFGQQGNGMAPSAHSPLASLPAVTAIVVPTATPTAAQAIIPDAGLAAEIRAQLGLAEGEPILLSQLGQIEELRIGVQTGAVVTDLSGLDQLGSLTVLDISGQTVADLSLLAELTTLTSLNLGGCALADPGILDKLPEGLRNLDLRQTGLTSVAFAARLHQLSYLNISGNAVADLSPLNGLPNLATLEAEGNPVGDWTAVSHVAVVGGMPEATPSPTLTATQPPAATVRPTVKPTVRPTVRPVATPAPTPRSTPKPTPKPTPSTVAVTGITLSRSSVLLDVGGGTALSATVSPANATNRTVRWSSSNPAVATVSSSGYVTAVGPGTTIITVSCGGYSASCTVSIG